MHEITVNGLLDAARDALRLKSDYALGKALEISHQKLGNWRHGRATPDEKACEVLARAAGLDADLVVAQVAAMRASDSQTRAIWERIASRLSVGAGSVAAVIFSAVVSLFSIAPDASATSAGEVSGYQNHSEELFTHRATLNWLFFCLLACLFLVSHRSFFNAWEHQK